MVSPFKLQVKQGKLRLCFKEGVKKKYFYFAMVTQIWQTLAVRIGLGGGREKNYLVFFGFPSAKCSML